MMLSSIRKAWELLNRSERRNALIVLGIMIVSAFAAAGMVGSIFPFLSVLSNPDLIRDNHIFAWVYQRGGFSSDFDFVVALGICSIIVIVVSSLMLLINTWVVTHFTQMLRHSLSYRLLCRYLTQPYEFFLNNHTDNMSANILGEAEKAVFEFYTPAMMMTSSLLTVLAVVGMLMVANPFVASLALAVFGTIYAVTLLITRRSVVTAGEKRAKANLLRFRLAGEAFAGIKELKLRGTEATYVDRFEIPSLLIAQMQSRVAVIAQAPRFMIQMIGFGGMILLALMLIDPVGFGRRDALAALLPLLGILAFAGQRLLPELQMLYNSATTLTAGRAALNNIHTDLRIGQELKINRSNPSPMRLREELALHDVTYTYPNANRAGLDRLSFTIAAGERIGIVGSSGAGKTTLADVILGLLLPQSGELYVDGVKISAGNMRAWQRRIGYVPQDIFLTDATLAENIALGVKPSEIDYGRVEQAARSAHIHDFVISDLPNGYATSIGERGLRLSGGQRQRLAIARALYHDADLILLDEATSALDNLTEGEVMAAIEDLPGSKTVIIIAHRLSTVQRCDKILMLERGKVVDIGTWEQLKERSEAFRDLISA